MTWLAAKERDLRKQEIREELYDEITGNIENCDMEVTKESLGHLGIREISFKV